VYPAGTIVPDPAGIRLFKSIIKEGKVVEVTEQNLDKLVHYFQQRMGLELKEDLEKALQGTTQETPQSTTVEPDKEPEKVARGPEKTGKPVVTLFGSKPTEK